MYETTTETGAKISVNHVGEYPFVKVVVPWDECILVPFADSHFGGGFNEDVGFKVRRFVEQTENALMTLGGDIVQNGNKKIGDMVFRLEMVPKEQKEYAGEFFKPIKSKIIGAIAGNHENWSFADTGDDFMQNILMMVGGDEWVRQFYMGSEIFGAICNEDESVVYTFYETHGKTFHKNSALAINSFRRDSGDWLPVDIRIRHHSHDMGFDFENVMVPNVRECRMDMLENYVVFGGHYQGRPDSYVAHNGMRPKPLGCMAVVMDMRYKGKDSVRGKRIG